MQNGSRSEASAQSTTKGEGGQAAFLRIHRRAPEEPGVARRFSAKLALQRAFVAAPTD